MPARKTGTASRRTYSLSDQDISNVDKLRVALDLKSDAAVIRKLIRDAAKEKLK